jgi:hypothetical protein
MPHDSSLKGYWDHANFRLVDTLNAEMWTRSHSYNARFSLRMI